MDQLGAGLALCSQYQMSTASNEVTSFYVGMAASFLSTLALSVTVLALFKFNLLALRNWMLRLQFFKERDFLLIPGLVLVGLLLLVPAILLLVYFIVTAVSFGRYPAVPILFAGLFLLAIFLPTAGKFTYLKFALIVAFLTVFQFTTLYLDKNIGYSNFIYTWYAQSGLFLFLNGALVSFCVLVCKFKYWTISEAMLNHRGAIVQKALSEEEISSPSLLYMGGLIGYLSKVRTLYRGLAVAGIYLVSLGLLAAYSASILATTSFLHVGTVISVVTVVLDLIILLMTWQQVSSTSPFVQVAIVFTIRACLSMFGPSLWYTGFCLIFIILGSYNFYLAAEHHLPYEDEIPNLGKRRWVNITRRPEFTLFLLVVIAVVVTGIMAGLGPSRIPSNVVELGGQKLAFWAVMIGSLLVTFSISTAIVCFRIYRRKDLKVHSIVTLFFYLSFCDNLKISLVVLQAIIILIGAFFYSLSKFALVWEACLFIPMMIFLLAVAFSSWRENDYEVPVVIETLNARIENERKAKAKRIERYAEIRRLTQQHNDVQDFLEEKQNEAMEREQFVEDWRKEGGFAAAFFSGSLPRTDYNIVVSLVLFLLMAAGFGVLVFFTNPDPTIPNARALYGWNISVTLTQLVLFLAPLYKIYRHHKYGLAEVISLALSLLLSVGYAIIYFISSGFTRYSSVYYLIFSLSFFPGLSFLALGYSYFEDKAHTFDKLSIAALAISAVLLLGGGGLSVWGIGVIPGVAIIVGVFFIYWVLFVLTIRAKTKQIPLPVVIVSAVLVLATFIGIIVASFISTTSDSIFGFSVAYLIVALTLVLGAGGVLIYWGQNQHVFFAPTFMPVFIMDEDKNQLRRLMLVPFLFLLGLGLLVVYGGIVASFVVPSQVGVAVTLIAEVVAVLAFVYFTTKNMYESGKKQQYLTNDLLTRSWAQTVEMMREHNGEVQGEEVRCTELRKQIENSNEGTRPQLQLLLQEAEEREQRVMVDWWLRSQMAISSRHRLMMHDFLNFIDVAEPQLIKRKIIFNMRNVTDVERGYSLAQAKLKMMNVEQRVRFDIIYAEWVKKQASRNSQQEEIRQKEEEERKRKEAEELKRLQEEEERLRNKNINDLPFAEMPEGPQKLKKRVEQLGGKLYEDNDFKDLMIPEEVKPLLQTTKRIEGGQLFSGQEGSAMEVKQGNLGDCYFISSMGVVFGSVKENFGMGTKEWSNPPGGYLVKFYKYGKEVYVMVDDRLPYSKEGELLFGKSEKGEKVLWPAILEKAYAKLNKGYANIAKGKMHIAMSEITGGYPTEIVLKEYADKIPILWAKLQQFVKNKCAMGAGSPDNPEGDSAVSPGGIVQRHAYEVLGIKTVDKSNLVYLRNPHGSMGVEWNGKWADQDSVWTTRLKSMVGFQAQEDGAFYMDIEDFMAEFSSLYVCRRFDPANWKSLLDTKGVFDNCDGLPSSKNLEAKLSNNPQFGIKVTKACSVYINLSQFKSKADNLFVGEEYLYFMVCRNEGKRITQKDKKLVVVDSGAPKSSMVATAEARLEASSYPYTFTLLVSNFLPRKRADYGLRIMIDDKAAELVPDGSLS